MLGIPSEIQDKKIEALITCEKLTNGCELCYKAPAPGANLRIPLLSPSFPEERFSLDIHEGKRNSSVILEIEVARKTTVQTRKASLPLVRVDIDDESEHTNPDGTIIRGSHVHLASSEYADRFAFPLESEIGKTIVGSTSYIPEIFESFKLFCHIQNDLTINWNLGI